MPRKEVISSARIFVDAIYQVVTRANEKENNHAGMQRFAA